MTEVTISNFEFRISNLPPLLSVFGGWAVEKFEIRNSKFEIQWLGGWK
jgi:hypothetical protein